VRHVGRGTVGRWQFFAFGLDENLLVFDFLRTRRSAAGKQQNCKHGLPRPAK
jgi:hypothetical protein